MRSDHRGRGSGKSTLIRCVNGLEEFGPAHWKWMARNWRRKAARRLPEIRKEVGMVFQQFNLFRT